MTGNPWNRGYKCLSANGVERSRENSYTSVGKSKTWYKVNCNVQHLYTVHVLMSLYILAQICGHFEKLQTPPNVCLIFSIVLFLNHQNRKILEGLNKL